MTYVDPRSSTALIQPQTESYDDCTSQLHIAVEQRRSQTPTAATIVCVRGHGTRCVLRWFGHLCATQFRHI